MSPRFVPSIPDNPARTAPPDDERYFEREEQAERDNQWLAEHLIEENRDV